MEVAVLKVSNIVYGRITNGNRVQYLVDPKGRGDEMAVPESVVLKRWRKRSLQDYTFSGARLSSTLWRAVSQSFGRNGIGICSLVTQQLQDKIDATRDELRNNGFLKLPSAGTLHAIFSTCGPDRLGKILERHLSDEHKGLSGVPDLFLFAKKQNNDQPIIAVFVEVKKPREPVSDVQQSEIDFLNSLNLSARVFRLSERV